MSALTAESAKSAKEERRLRNAPLINAAAVRKLALEVREAHRPYWPASRVSKSFIDRINRVARVEVIASVKNHPTKGRTIR